MTNGCVSLRVWRQWNAEMHDPSQKFNSLPWSMQPDITPAHQFQPTSTPHSIPLCIRKYFFKYTPITYKNSWKPMNITHLLPIQLDPEQFLRLLLWWQQCSHLWVIPWSWHEHVYLQLAGWLHWEALWCLLAYWNCKFNNVTHIKWK